MLLAAGADVNAQDRIGRTPLACLFHSAEPAKTAALTPVLLQWGADPTIARVGTAGEQDSTPLSEAVRLMPWRVNAVTGGDVAASAVTDLQQWRRVVQLPARATAWRRRRHLLLVIRDRLGAGTAAGVGGAGGSA